MEGKNTRKNTRSNNEGQNNQRRPRKRNRFPKIQSDNSESIPKGILCSFKSSSQKPEKLSDDLSNCYDQPNKKRINNTQTINRKEQWSKKEPKSKNLSDTAVSANGNRTENKFGFGFKRLEELCNKDLPEIIFVVSNKSNGFIDLFKQNKEPDWIFLLVKISAKLCSSEFIQSKTALLTELICNTFFEHLKTYILSTPTEKKSNRCNNMNAFFDDCLIVFQSITTLFPKTAADRLKEIVISSNIALNGINNYCNHIQINEKTTNDMNELLQKLNETVLTKDLELKEKIVFDNIAQYFPPPENFRELTVYPTAIDLEYGERFLRPNISKGVYQDVEHYLDVQFRLLREDFIAPLREGIHFYKESMNDKQQNKRQKKINNIRVYRDVEFEEKGEFIYDRNGFLINFDRKKKLKINWEMAKRFMYGSLLLFTENEFRTFFLGVVLERKIELLKQGKLIVELLEDSKPVYGRSLTMVESEVFFEPYKCSMEVLKTVNRHNFPMEKYIISACNQIDYPIYIDTLPDRSYLIDGSYRFDLLSENWPTKEQLGLDIMQYRAFKAALTHEFAVIQGPPGTGKTFIGLKIMGAIINNLYGNVKNVKLSMNCFTKPIIIVCYTNHALDQFMEGILNFTKRVVRIGGQSKSEIIEKYSLRNITRMFRRTITTNHGLRNVSDRVKRTMDEIKYFRRCSEVLSYNAGVIELSLLKNGMPKKYHNYFKTTWDLLSWLFQDVNYFAVDPIEFIKVFCKDELVNRVFHSEKLLEIKHKVGMKDDCDDYDYDDVYRRHEVDDPDFELNQKNIVIYSITLDDVKSVCKELLTESVELEALSNEDLQFYNKSEEVKFNFNVMEQIHDYFTYMLNLADADVDIPLSFYDLNELDMKQRWTLYFSWVRTTQARFGPKIMDLEQNYAHIYRQYSELKELENIDILSNMHVIALTTTGAAKHRVMLQGLESPIVVVEEAAEVLEAHIISSLTRHCQHLILIGDHKQLRPSNAVYKLAKDFNFDISLFERMVNNNVPCYTLGEQHRMRPEIASLISPSIYPELQNHVSVLDRECVRGVTKNLFFLNHNMYEKEVDEISSKSNEHEAKFLIMFARHLILQGYKTEQVTILTTYSGQLFQFRALRKKHSILDGMRIVVVDNYQGEENDIILLSLVRSNEKGNVGFLKTENRICVALSRAKYGLYIMGNMDNLYNSGSMWKKIKKTLVDQDSYGDELTLECAIHSGITTKVSKSEDFNIIMEGGCTMLCNSLLPCGHLCTSICHSYDRNHEFINCQEPCSKSCDYNHPCKNLCFMECGKCTESMLKVLPCDHQITLPCFVDSVSFPCKEKVQVVLDACKHEISKKCYDKNPSCTFKCFDRLDCGHACNLNCHKNDDPDHEKYKCMKSCENVNKNCSLNHKCRKLCHEPCSDCTVRVKKKLPCGHTNNSVPCGLEDSKVKCNLPCDRLLPCGHKCKTKCFETCKPCEIKVTKIIPDCGHAIQLACSTEPTRERCTEICIRTLDCGHKCTHSCSKECATKKCEEIVLQKISLLACGHDKVYVKCCDKEKDFRMDSQYLLDNCREPCLENLNCDDVCLGTCGQCKQGRLHVPCSAMCNKINPCSHTCQFPCKQRCPPCNKKCLFSCVHSSCNRKCGQPCVQCKEECVWECFHLKCTKKCGEICNRGPCYEPCMLKLDCMHDCIGFCGEPCPPLCRVCHRDEVTTIIFGNEDEPDARFVYLNDCGHSIESQALEQWMNQNDEEISLKQCPICKTPILKTLRFMNRVKIILQDITKIKTKLYGDLNALKVKNRSMLASLKTLDKRFYVNFIGDVGVAEQVKDLWDILCQPLLQHKQKPFSLPVKDIESVEFVIDLLKSILKYKKRIGTVKDDHKKRTVVDHFVWLLSVALADGQQLSSQQKIDINMEMARGARILNLSEIMSNRNYLMAVGMNTSAGVEVINLVQSMEALLMSCRVYTKERDDEIQSFIELIEERVAGLEIIVTDEERKMIHQAMAREFHGGVRAQGHWHKCPNGHIYCIADCGRPMQTSICPECKVQIGGQGHTHVQGITSALEMERAARLA